VTSALEMLDALAFDTEPVRTSLRCARVDDDSVAIDLGTADGKCVVVAGGKWSIEKRPPDGILFRRTTVTSAMPMPRRGGNLTRLRSMFALNQEAWNLVRAWLILAWLEDIPVPVLGLLGPNGAGKSYLAQAMVKLVDPAPALLRRLPSQRRDWPIIVNGSRVLALDNISRMSLDVSDDISSAVTGAGTQNRALYTDEDQVVFNYRRAFILTSIDPGAMQGDFAERLMVVNLPPMSEDRRRGERDMDSKIDRMMPSLLAALLDSVARVLANPVELDELPRMADAAKVMASLDALAPDSDSLGAYHRSLGNAVERVLESDPLAQTMLTFMDRRDRWVGTPTELYDALLRSPMVLPEHNWPANAQKLSERLTRLTVPLKAGKGLVVARRRDDERILELSWNGRAVATVAS
jgi:hypothetical protein